MESPHTLIPCLASFVAFLLGILCLFAGSQRQCLPKADLLTLHLESMTNAIPGAPDFFSVYVMSYCEGVKEVCEQNGTTGPCVVTTTRSCSDINVLFSFNPTEALNTALTAAGYISPSDAPPLGWPSYLTDDFDALKPTNHTMAVFYVMGTTAAGLVLLLKLLTIWSSRRTSGEAEKPPSSLLLLLLQMTSAVTLGISSVLGSVISTQFVELINKSGAPLGISADHGTALLGMSWTAVTMQMIGTLHQAVMLLMNRGKYHHCKDEEPEKPEKPEKPEPVASEDEHE